MQQTETFTNASVRLFQLYRELEKSLPYGSGWALIVDLIEKSDPCVNTTLPNLALCKFRGYLTAEIDTRDHPFIKEQHND